MEKIQEKITIFVGIESYPQRTPNLQPLPIKKTT
jgi:hypothetical protein